MRTDWMRLVGWVIPLGCMAVAAFLIFQQNARIHVANDLLATAQHEEALATSAREAATLTKGPARVVTAKIEPSEEPKFLNGLRGHAEAANVHIEKWSSHRQSAAPPAAKSDGTPDPNATKLAGIVKISSELTVTGAYKDIRTFLSTLANSNRLYTFSDIRWSRKAPTTELTLTVTRYVDSPGTPAAEDPNKKTQ